MKYQDRKHKEEEIVSEDNFNALAAAIGRNEFGYLDDIILDMLEVYLNENTIENYEEAKDRLGNTITLLRYRNVIKAMTDYIPE